jgi:hypothetical protein
VRFGFVLLVVCGCDLVIPLTEPEPAVCGPYRTVTPVLFEEALGDPSDFSVHYNGIEGMVRARVANGPTAIYTGPVPIVFDEPSGTWKLDTNRFPRGMPALELDGGHVLGDGTVLGWRDRTSQTLPRVHRYAFNTLWTQITTESIETETGKNFRPGNEIVLMAEGDPLRFLAMVKQDFNGVERGQLEVRQKFDTDPWGPTEQAAKITRFVQHDPLSAVLSADHSVIVYAAREGGGKPQIFASLRNRQEDKYDVGTPVMIELDGDVDDTEPWIGENCLTLYFRRGGVTYRAQ